MSLFFILIVPSLFVISQSCKCRPPNITVSYCRADVVAHVKVVNVSMNNTEFPGSDYGIEYIKIYRKTEKYNTVKDKNIVETPPAGGGCGLTIDVKSKNNEWLLFGLVGHKQIFINICSSNSVWSKDLKSQLEGSLSKLNCSTIALEGNHKRNATSVTTTHKPKLF